MRWTAAWLLCLPALAAPAKGPAEIRNEAWGFRYRAPELRPGPRVGRREVLLRARGESGLRIELRVEESARARSAKDWMEAAEARWKRARRKLAELRRTDDRIFFVEPKYGVFEQPHAYRFAVRGRHCFVLHAWAEDRAEGVGRALERALAGLALDPDPGFGLRVPEVAARLGKPLLDPGVLVEAGRRYVAGGPYEEPIPEIGLRLLERARARPGAGDLPPAARLELEMYGGRALLGAGRYREARAWLERAEALAKGPEHRRARARCAYDLARASARMGDKQAAFDALRRAFSGAPPVSRERLSKEKDFRPLREDPRWDRFWAECVAPPLR